MKIVIDGRMMRWTGIGRYITELVASLGQIDHENQYSVLLQRPDLESWVPPGPNFHPVLADIGPYSVDEQRQLGKLIGELQPDLAHFTHFTVPLGYNQPFVVTIHDLTLLDHSTSRASGPIQALRYAAKRQAMKSVFRHAITKSRAILTPTNYVKQELVKRYSVPETKITVTHEAGDPVTKTPKAYPPLEKQQFILCVGNAYPYKNLERLAVAFGQLAEPNHKLVLVGKKDHFYTKLEAFVATKKIQNIVFTGYLPDAELAWMYEHAAAYVFPSLSEGFGLPGLEAMAYGLPVISSNATCLPEVYGKAAHYFDPLDPADMAAKIGEVLDDAKLREQLIKAGSSRIKDFSWERMAQQTLEVYRKALG